MRFAICLLLCFAPASVNSVTADEPKPAAPKPTSTKPAVTRPAAPDPYDLKTLEGALRTFVLGMLLSDAKLLDKSMWPESEADTAVLLKSQGEPPAILAGPMVAIMKVRRLKAGEKFVLPGNREITIGADEVTEERAVLVLDDGPVPTRVAKDGDTWRVDAGTFIASRKAGAAYLEKQKREAAERGEKRKTAAEPRQ